jgi:hypothetical protein
MTKLEITDILNNIFGYDTYSEGYSEFDELDTYVFQSIEMEEVVELSKQITAIDPSNTFKISIIPEQDGLTIIFFKWMQ